MQQQGAIVYALMRLASAAPTLLLVIVLAFLMMRAAPGGPFDDERAPPPETAANIERAYDLDAPLKQQLSSYILGVLRGDLGPSYRYPDYTVSELIAGALPVSAQIGALALLVAVLLGSAFGIWAAVRHNTVTDRALTGLAMTGISVPVFVIAPLLILVFAVQLDWLPASWAGSAGVEGLLLPVAALSLPQIAYVARLMRASMIEVLSSDYIRTARAQGLSTATIVTAHALRPALLPLLSYLGPAIAAVLTGSVVVEQIFGVPGLGQLFVRAALNRDYPLVLGIVILYAVLVIALNLIVDILYGFVDPRIRRR
ncbi:MAG: ABC transporter permease subunit [Pseudomonadota bacterium]